MPISRVAEYSRHRKNEGMRRVRRILLCVSYGLFGILSAVGVLLGNIFLLSFFVCLLIAFVLLTLPFFRETIDYEIIENEMRLYRVYGNSRSRLAFRCDLSKAMTIEPLTAETGNRFRAMGIRKMYDFLSFADSPDAYYALFNEGEQTYALLFDCDEKFRQVIRYINPRVFVTR